AWYSACTNLRCAWDRDLMIWRRPPASAAPLSRATSASRLDPVTATPAPRKRKSTPVAPIANRELICIGSLLRSKKRRAALRAVVTFECPTGDERPQRVVGQVELQGRHRHQPVAQDSVAVAAGDVL